MGKSGENEKMIQMVSLLIQTFSFVRIYFGIEILINCQINEIKKSSAILKIFSDAHSYETLKVKNNSIFICKR